MVGAEYGIKIDSEADEGPVPAIRVGVDLLFGRAKRVVPSRLPR